MEETKIQNYLAEALFNLLETNNLNDITITLLCNKAGTSRMTFYRYFKNTTDVIDYYLNQKYTIFKDNLELLYLRNKNLLEELNYIFEYIKDNYKILFILKKIDFNLLNNKTINLINFNNIQGYESYFYKGAIINVSRHWIETGMKETPNEMSKIVYDIIQKSNKN